MSAEQDTLRVVFAAALTKPSPEERERYLAEACGKDHELRRQVDSLLLAHAQAGDFLKQNVIAPNGPPIGEGPGSVIGRYKLLQQIGEGGFGVVFMAEQQEPVRRMVALKIIKAGMDTREVVARFEAERQALALMDHPNIARILDGGATASGRPYFVMDLVKGIPITEFCDQHHLPAEARLQLFMKVCAGVQHAHQKGVIHRDLKPTNVLVTLHDGEPVPKVIDFGVAKAIGQKLTERTLFTRFEQLLGTPAYMSPEQAEWSGLDIDTRSDLYSLGVLLYELLTGTTPLEKQTLARAALDEMRRMIRETDPPMPSTRLTAILAAGGARLPPSPRIEGAETEARQEPNPTKFDSATLHRRLQAVRGDLDWIVMKALEKDRTRRYETVNGLARDIERHLDGEPVVACPPSKTYRASKFVRRHRGAVTAVAGVALALVAGLVLALLGFTQARCANKRAQEEAAIARAVNDFLLFDLLEQASPENTTNREVTVREVLDRAAAKIKDRFTNQPLEEASIRQTVGDVYRWLYEYDLAEVQLRRTVELRRENLGPENPRTLDALTALAFVMLEMQGRESEAGELLRRIAEIGRRTLNLDNPEELERLNHVARMWSAWARTDEADDLLRLVLEKERRQEKPEDWRILQTMGSLADLCIRLGRFSEAAALSDEVLRVERAVEKKNWFYLNALETAGTVQFSLGDYPKAAELWKEDLDLVRGGWRPHEWPVQAAVDHLVLAYGALGEWTNCAGLCREITPSTNDLKRCAFSGFCSAVASLLVSDTSAYRESAGRMLTQFAGTTNADWARMVGEVCFLAPDSVPDLGPAFKLAERAPKNEADTAGKIARGMAEYRRGNLTVALEWLEGPRHSAQSSKASQAGYFCAMIHHRQGDTAAAQAALEEAAKRLGWVLRSGELGESWHEYARAAITRAEAERLILGRQLTPFVDAASLASARQRWAPVRRHLNEADRLAAQQKWTEAHAEYFSAMQEPEFDWEAAENADLQLANRIGITSLLAKDYAGHDQLCRAWFSRLAKRPDPWVAFFAVRTCLPGTIDVTTDPGRSAVEWAQAVESIPEEVTEEVSLIHAMAAYRSARYPEAIENSKAAEKSAQLAIRSAAQIFRAMSLGKSGRLEQGKKELQKAETQLGRHLTTFTGDYWWDLGLCQLALNEAHRLFGEPK